MIKLSTGASFVATAKRVAPSEESLIEAAEQLSAASEALFEAQIAGEEICQVMGNIDLALESISQYGLTKQTLGIFNSEGELCACCGMENLTVAGLEAAGEEAVKKAEDKTKLSLGQKAKEYWAKFVAWLKNLWAKIVDWFKKLWQNRARWFKTLDDVSKMKAEEFNGDAKAIVISAGNFKKAVAIKDKIFDEAETFAGLFRATSMDANLSVDADQFNKDIDECFKIADNAEAKKLSEQGWNYDNFIKMVAEVKAAAKGIKMQELTTKCNNFLKVLIAEAGKAANAEDAKAAKEAVQKKREAVMKCLQLIRVENSLMNKMFTQIWKVKKAAQSKKEEPKK